RRRRRGGAARADPARRSRAPRNRGAPRPPPSRRRSSRCPGPARAACRRVASSAPDSSSLARAALELLLLRLAVDAQLGHRSRAQPRDADLLAAHHAVAVLPVFDLDEGGVDLREEALLA